MNSNSIFGYAYIGESVDVQMRGVIDDLKRLGLCGCDILAAALELKRRFDFPWRNWPGT